MNKENANGFQKENLEIILNEFSEDMKTMQQNVSDMITSINALQHKVNSFPDLVKNQNVNVITDTKPIQDIMRKGVLDIILAMSKLPKKEEKKWQILLFPEQDAKLFYKIVFSRWFLWLVISFAIANFYKLGSQWIEKEKAIELSNQKQREGITRVWNIFYQQGNPQTKEKMDTLLNQQYEVQ